MAWTSKSQAELADVWREATDLGGALPLHASAVCEVRFELPQTFVVVFPENGKMQRDFCENERTTIESRLSVILGAPVVLRFASRYSLERPNITPNGKFKSPSLENDTQKGNKVSTVDVRLVENDQSVISPAPSNYSELRREVYSNEIAQQILDIFGAELSDLKQASQLPNQYLNRGYEYE